MYDIGLKSVISGLRLHLTSVFRTIMRGLAKCYLLMDSLLIDQGETANGGVPYEVSDTYLKVTVGSSCESGRDDRGRTCGKGHSCGRKEGESPGLGGESSGNECARAGGKSNTW